jgi:hypothetical protein
MSSNAKVWFPAKRYGWGWGLPLVWQGWAVYGIFLVLLVAGACVIPPPKHPALWAGFLLCWSAGLLAIAWFKGEKPQWRWGGR